MQSYNCRYLAGGPFFEQYAASHYRISPAASSIILRETCRIIYEELADGFMEFTKENWINVSNKFYSTWNMPNCLVAIDGKHVKLKCPPNAGSLYYNYKVIQHKIKYLFVAQVFVIVTLFMIHSATIASY